MSTKEISPISVVVPVRIPAFQHDSEVQYRAFDDAHSVLCKETLPRQRFTELTIHGIRARCQSMLSLDRSEVVRMRRP